MSDEPTPEDLYQMVTAQPMRRLLTMVCLHCKREWTAPAQGNCPQCHSDRTIKIGSRISGLKTV